MYKKIVIHKGVKSFSLNFVSKQLFSIPTVCSSYVFMCCVGATRWQDEDLRILEGIGGMTVLPYILLSTWWVLSIAFYNDVTSGFNTLIGAGSCRKFPDFRFFFFQVILYKIIEALCMYFTKFWPNPLAFLEVVWTLTPSWFSNHGYHHMITKCSCNDRGTTCIAI